jgi:hypothetical protein
MRHPAFGGPKGSKGRPVSLGHNRATCPCPYCCDARGEEHKHGCGCASCTLARNSRRDS